VAFLTLWQIRVLKKKMQPQITQLNVTIQPKNIATSLNKDGIAGTSIVVSDSQTKPGH
jgi:hypothetical protein